MSPPDPLPIATSVADNRHAASARGALAALSLAVLMASLGTSIANVALPGLASAFAASFQAAQWVVLAYLLAITSLIVSAGRLGDLLGRRRLLLGGIGLFTTASLLAGAAPTLPLLIAARAVQGFGAAIMMSLTLAFVADVVPKDRGGRAMGLLGTMSAMGTALGPSLGGALLEVFGWRAVFFVNLPLGVAALLLGVRHLPRDHSSNPEGRASFDGVGTVLLALGLGAYALAMTVGRGHFGIANVTLALVALAGGALFVLAETRVASPLIRPGLFRATGLRSGLGLSALVATVIMATLVVGPFYLAHGLGLAPAATGLAMTVGPLVAAGSGVPAGRLTDKFGTIRITQVGLGGMAVGTLLLTLLPTGGGLFGYLGPIALVTAGYGVFQTANNAAVMAGIAAGQRGTIAGLLNLSRHLGLITGTAVLGAVFTSAAGTSDIRHAAPDDLATGMRVTFGVGALVIGSALLLSHRMRHPLVRPGTTLNPDPARTA